METCNIRAVIIDDEEKSRRVLKSLLAKFHTEVSIVGEADNISDAYHLIELEKPSLVFLDVQMPLGTGFDLLRKFEHINFDVIFITGYDQYAINAIKFNALDYLLKPIEVEDLSFAVRKALENNNSKTSEDLRLTNLLEGTISENLERKIIVHKNDKVILLPLKEIVFIESDGRYCKIHNIESNTHIISRTLKEIEEYLIDQSAFFRITKNAIVNLNFLSNYTKGEPCFVEMKTGEQFEVSRRRKQLFLERIKNA